MVNERAERRAEEEREEGEETEAWGEKEAEEEEEIQKELSNYGDAMTHRRELRLIRLGISLSRVVCF